MFCFKTCLRGSIDVWLQHVLIDKADFCCCKRLERSGGIVCWVMLTFWGPRVPGGLQPAILGSGPAEPCQNLQLFGAFRTLCTFFTLLTSAAHVLCHVSIYFHHVRCHMHARAPCITVQLHINKYVYIY